VKEGLPSKQRSSERHWGGINGVLTRLVRHARFERHQAKAVVLDFMNPAGVEDWDAVFAADCDLAVDQAGDPEAFQSY
jgi:hypothetical protein